LSRSRHKCAHSLSAHRPGWKSETERFNVNRGCLPLVPRAFVAR
jgi:hypothetical protein